MVREEFTATDVIYKTVVAIQNGFALSHNIYVCERHWRYLLNVFPEVEKDVPADIMDAIKKYREAEKVIDE
jgi:hypothetical protein